MDHDELNLERQHLKDTIAIARAQWDEAAKDQKKHAETIRTIQEERMEENPLDVGGLYSAQGFLDLLELSQGTQSLARATTAQRESELAMRRLARMMEAPYFARIDFRAEGSGVRPIYIGRATLMEEDSMEIHVYDWRVPIASVFYQYGVGPAEYQAPAGIIRGEVLLKRQYEIREGELLYYFDADEQVLDTFLRELLSRPAAPAMKSIVETIQRDQDRIIRDLKTDLLMVQGTAGSGKTSVALHRVAYLMYQGLQSNRLSPNDILIIAPNATFERYISHVLPDLGENQVQTMLFEDLLGDMLPHAHIERRSVWVEAWLRQSAGRKGRMRLSRSFKGSAAFIQVLDRLIHELPRRWLPFCDVDYDGKCVAHAELSRAAICNSTRKVPLGIRLRMLEREIWGRIREHRPARYEKLLRFAGQFPEHAIEAQAYARMLSIRESGIILRRLRAFTRISCVALYRAVFADKASFARLARGLLQPDEAEAIRAATLERLGGDELPYEDAMAIAYLEARIHGCRAYTHMRQVVVDEAQDLDALHATLLGLLFPYARFTILGDAHQTLAGSPNPSLYDEIQVALRKKSSLLVTLDKSFRCTREIWAFSAQFLPAGASGECFSRSGEPPAIFAAADVESLDALLIRHAQLCGSMGCQSVALVCKTQQDARRLYARLKDKADVSLVGNDGAENARGVSIISLYMAKGLEFDAVLLCDVDADHYHGEEDKSLLYIGCTRALHVLRLFYAGERSPLLPADEEVCE